MTSLWEKLGRAGFWLAWPALFVYLRLTERTRVLVIAEGKVLLIKSWLGDGRWSLPGGGLHRHEVPLTGALRELAEETGLQLSPQALRARGRHAYRDKGFRFRYHLFVAELERVKKVRIQRLEITSYQWIAPERATRLSLQPDVRKALEQWRA